jgi:hypothetical protein
VQGKDDRDSSFLGHADEVRGQAGDMMKMDNVGANLIEKLPKLPVDDIASIRLLKRITLPKGVVNLKNRKPVEAVGNDHILVERAIRNPGENENRMALCQLLREVIDIELRAR